MVDTCRYSSLEQCVRRGDSRCDWRGGFDVSSTCPVGCRATRMSCCYTLRQPHSAKPASSGLQILLNSMGVMEEEQLSHPRCFSTPNIVGPSATFQRAGGACIYTTSNSVYGSRYPTEMRPPRFGLSNKFSKSVGEFPRLEISGPDSKITPFCRYMYGTTDWTSRMG